MLKITIPETEFFDETKEEFVYVKERELKLEHSLLSISKWESKYEKPFLDKAQKTPEEIFYYIKCMTLTPNVDDYIFSCLTKDNLDSITDYIQASQTATTFSSNGRPSPPNRELITSELVYFWMVNYNIPFECEKWHINRLLTLVRICNIKNNTDNKMSKKSVMSQNRALNEARKAKLKTNG